MYEFILRLFRANTADSCSIVSQKEPKAKIRASFSLSMSSARQSLSCYKWMDNKIPQHKNGDLRKCKGSVKLIKCEIYGSFTSALHHSKVMFSCCDTRAATKVCIHQTHASSRFFRLAYSRARAIGEHEARRSCWDDPLAK